MAKDSTRGELVEKVVKIKRCAAVVKGGRRFSFAAMVVVGNGPGRVGWGYGKANEVPPSVEKAVKEGTRSLHDIRARRSHDPASRRWALSGRPRRAGARRRRERASSPVLPFGRSARRPASTTS